MKITKNELKQIINDYLFERASTKDMFSKDSKVGFKGDSSDSKDLKSKSVEDLQNKLQMPKGIIVSDEVKQYFSDFVNLVFFIPKITAFLFI